MHLDVYSETLIVGMNTEDETNYWAFLGEFTCCPASFLQPNKENEGSDF